MQENIKNMIESLYREGVSSTLIAGQIGVHPSTVQRLVKKIGITRNRQGNISFPKPFKFPDIPSSVKFTTLIQCGRKCVNCGALWEKGIRLFIIYDTDNKLIALCQKCLYKNNII